MDVGGDQVQLNGDADAPGEVIGRRVGAALLDLLLLGVLLIVVGIVAGQASSGHGHASVQLHGAPAVVFVCLSLAYYFAMEAATGATLGKRALGLSVVGPDGRSPSAGRVALRTVLRIVDALPLLYLLGFVATLFTGGRRRLGDLAAGTSVTAT